jgi:multicomponent Na+:H+ antiporter subunit D
VTDGLLPLAVVVPLAGASIAFLAGGRGATLVGLAGSVLTAALGLAIAALVILDGAQRHALGGWVPPLGIELRADGLSVAMLVTTAVVGLPVSLFAMGQARDRIATGDRPSDAGRESADAGHDRGSAPADHAVHPPAFWPRWLFLWGSLNALFLASDVFNVYITLELVTLAAVGLVLLSDEQAALVAGLRYLLVAFFGSVAYLLGVGLVYGATGTLAFEQVAEQLGDAPAVPAAAALMTVGLAVKSALLPFHAWLPPAHSRAPAPASAVLSGLVVMAGLYLLVRLWLGVFPETITIGATVVGIVGLAALAYGSVRAVLAPRLKLLLAWSTVAQVGLIVLAIPAGLAAMGAGAVDPLDPAAAAGVGSLAAGAGTGLTSAATMPLAVAGGSADAAAETRAGMALLAGAHALAKASLFLVAGLVASAVGHDRIRDLGAPWRRMPLATLAVVLAGASLLGVPGTGGEAGKHALADLARDGGAWWWSVAMDASALLTGAYLAVLGWALLAPVREASGGPSAGRSGGEAPVRDRQAPRRGPGGGAVPVGLQLIPLSLASLTLVAGWFSEPLLGLLATGLGS